MCYQSALEALEEKNWDMNRAMDAFFLKKHERHEVVYVADSTEEEEEEEEEEERDFDARGTDRQGQRTGWSIKVNNNVSNTYNIGTEEI